MYNSYNAYKHNMYNVGRIGICVQSCTIDSCLFVV